MSFDPDEGDDDQESEEEEIELPEIDEMTGKVKKRRLGKNPDVDTSFLPDRDREEEENKMR